MPAMSLPRRIGLVMAVAFVTGTHGHLARAVDGELATTGATVTEKFPSEAETRAAMEAIRQRVINVHTLITHRRMPVATAAQFARETSADIARIEQLRGKSDGQSQADPITAILKQITSGAATIAQPSHERGQVDGLVDVVSALETYGATFDHPGWRSLRQQ